MPRLDTLTAVGSALLLALACSLSSASAPSSGEARAGLASSASHPVRAQDFGTEEDVAFAKRLWSKLEGYGDWKLASGFYPGRSPHGDMLRLYSSFVTVDGESLPVIIKDNYRGEGLTQKALEKDARSHLSSATVMLKRAAGYDPEGGDWFYAKYDPDGALMTMGDDGPPLAGRVAGCARCHSQAKGDDHLFFNDAQ